MQGRQITDQQPQITSLQSFDVWCLAGLFLLAVLILSPVLLAPAGYAPGLPGEDGRTQWYPWRHYAAHWIRQGVLPLWNPHILCGVPFLGNFQSAMFYPPNAVFLVADVWLAARLSILFHLWLSLFFTYRLARAFRCGWAGCAVAAMAFTFCGPQLLRVPAGHWGVSCAIPWLPLVFLCVELLMRESEGHAPSRRRADAAERVPPCGRRSVRLVVLGAFAVGMQVLAGVPQYVFITGLAVGAWALLRGFGEGLTWKDRWVRWAAVAGVFVLGAAISAVQLLPGIETARHGARSLPMRKEWVELFSLGPENILTFLIPGFFGGTRGTPYWGRFLFWEMNGYVGIVTLVLAVVALFWSASRGIARRFVLLAALMFVLALGKHTPLMGVLTAVLPFSGMFRGSAKFLLPVCLALAVLGGMGAEALLEDREKAWRRLKAPAAVGAATLLCSLIVAANWGAMNWAMGMIYRNGECLSAQIPPAYQSGANILSHSLSQTAFILALAAGGLWFRSTKTKTHALGAVLLVALLGADMLRYGSGYVGRNATFHASPAGWCAGLDRPPIWGDRQRRVLVQNCPDLNDPMLCGAYAVEGIEPNPPARFHRLFMRSQGWPEDIAPSVYQVRIPNPILPLASVRYVVAPEAVLRPRASKDVQEIAPGWWVEDWALGVPRAHVTRTPEWAVTADAALNALVSRDSRPARAVVLEGTAPLRRHGDITGSSSVAMEISRPNEVVLRAKASHDAWLFLRDNWSPGWQAEVDGKRAEILHADYAFRAVALPAGEHEVTFRYRPLSIITGAWVSGAAVAGCGLVLLAGRRRRGGP